jgi:NAD-dependent DNA ligase
MQKKPNILELTQIDGIGIETSKNFFNNIDAYIKYIKLNDLQQYCVTDTKTDEKISKHVLTNIKILFSGSKDKELIQLINKQGGEVVSSINKFTNILIMNDPNEETIKQKYAIKNGIKVMTPDEFRNLYQFV